MCEELNELLGNGRSLAQKLVDHLFEMGAGRCEIPVETEKGKFMVIVEPHDFGTNTEYAQKLKSIVK